MANNKGFPLALAGILLGGVLFGPGILRDVGMKDAKDIVSLPSSLPALPNPFGGGTVAGERCIIDIGPNEQKVLAPRKGNLDPRAVLSVGDKVVASKNGKGEIPYSVTGFINGECVGVPSDAFKRWGIQGLQNPTASFKVVGLAETGAASLKKGVPAPKATPTSKP